MHSDKKNYVFQVVSITSVMVAFLTFQWPFSAFAYFLWLINSRLSISITLMTILAKGTSKTNFASFQPKQLSVIWASEKISNHIDFCFPEIYYG